MSGPMSRPDEMSWWSKHVQQNPWDLWPASLRASCGDNARDKHPRLIIYQLHFVQLQCFAVMFQLTKTETGTDAEIDALKQTGAKTEM